MNSMDKVLLDSIESNFTKEQLFVRNLWLEYFNGYITYEVFAEHKGLPVAVLHEMLKAGAYIHDDIAELYKSKVNR